MPFIAKRLLVALIVTALLENVAVPGGARKASGQSDELESANALVVDQKHPQASDQNSGRMDAPLKTIGKAVSLADPGQMVLVRAGVYREDVRITKSGLFGRRIILKSAPGERVVVSGADEIKGWRKCTKEELRGNPNFEHICCAELDWAPVQLFLDGSPDSFRVARWPKGEDSKLERDSYPVEAGDQVRLVDSKRLDQPAGFWEGGILAVWRASNDSVAVGKIVGYRPENHELTVDKTRGNTPVIGKDRYYVYNLVTLISEPGEYSIDSSRKLHRLYLWPPKHGDPNQQSIEGSRRQHAIRGENVSHVTVEGIEAARTYGVGLSFHGGGQNEILRCLAYHCRQGPKMAAAFGISLSVQTHSAVRRSISVLNSYGIGISESTNCVVEGNLSGRHHIDAIAVSWHSMNVRIARNYVFDNWDTGHPDGFQTYRDVQGLVLDSNLFLSVGQGWQCAETQDALVTNNIWAGIHWPNSISCSLRKAVVGEQNLRNTFVNNTFFGGAVASGGESRFLNNVVIPPSFGGTSGGPPVESDHNLVWFYPSYTFKWSAADGKRAQRGSFAQWQQATGANPHSQFANPRFRNAPLFERSLSGGDDEKRAGDTIFLEHGDVGGFTVGDFVEIDCDGVKRAVRKLGSGFIVVEPLLDSPYRGGLSFIWNWRKNDNSALDLRLAGDSPGKRIGKNGEDVGSSIDIQAYMQGDFDGDNKRDVPLLPQELTANRQLMKLLR